MGAKLHVLRLDLPGLWSDGWLYKEHLLLWARDGLPHVVRLADLAAELGELGSPPLEAVADHLLFHTEWKTGEQFSRLLLIPGIEEKFIADFPESGNITIPIGGVTAEPIPAATPVPGVILDSAIYANRVYLGTIEGLFETRFDPDSPTRANRLVSRMEKRVSVVTAGYSAVNGSAGEEGLWFGRMHFGDEPWWDEKSSFRQVADFSRGNSFADVNLLNYTGDAFPGFLRSETSKERQHGNSERDDRQITGYREATDIGGLMASALRKKRRTSYNIPELDLGIDDGSADVLGNSGKRLLVAWNDSLRVVDLSVRQDRDLAAKQDSAFQAMTNLEIDPYAILDTHAFGKGFLVELSKEVRLINAQGSFTLIAEPVVRIRTFARSRRYKEVVLLIRETGVSLLGMYLSQDDRLPPLYAGHPVRRGPRSSEKRCRPA